MSCGWSHPGSSNFTKNLLTFVVINEVWKWISAISYQSNSGPKQILAYLTWPGTLAQKFAVWKGEVGKSRDVAESHRAPSALPACLSGGRSVAGPRARTAVPPFQPRAAWEMGRELGLPRLLQLAGEVMTHLSILLFWPPCTVFPTRLFPLPTHGMVWFWLLHGGICVEESPCTMPPATQPWSVDTTAGQFSINNMPTKAGSCRKQSVSV